MSNQCKKDQAKTPGNQAHLVANMDAQSNSVPAVPLHETTVATTTSKPNQSIGTPVTSAIHPNLQSIPKRTPEPTRQRRGVTTRGNAKNVSTGTPLADSGRRIINNSNIRAAAANKIGTGDILLQSPAVPAMTSSPLSGAKTPGKLKAKGTKRATSNTKKTTSTPKTTPSTKPTLKKRNTKRRNKFRVTNAKRTSSSQPESTPGDSPDPARREILDEEPTRIMNPLVDLPPVDSHDPPNSSELHSWSEIVFGRLDTYPLSYYGRLLGFHVPDVPTDQYLSLDQGNLKLKRPLPPVPPLGPPLPPLFELEYQDPVYRMLSEEQADSIDLKRAIFNTQNTSRALVPSCLLLAKELLGSNLPQFDIRDNSTTSFGIVAEGGYSIRYQFDWYQYIDPSRRCNQSDFYGIPSGASHIRKKSAELIVQITHLGRDRQLQDEVVPPAKETKKPEPMKPGKSRILEQAIQRDDSNHSDKVNVGTSLEKGGIPTEVKVTTSTPHKEVGKNIDLEAHPPQPAAEAPTGKTAPEESQDLPAEKVQGGENRSNNNAENHDVKASDITCDSVKNTENKSMAVIAPDRKLNGDIPRGNKDGEDSLSGMKNDVDERILLVLTALALEHAKGSDVFYGVAKVPEKERALLKQHFRMTEMKAFKGETLLFDISRCNPKCAFLSYLSSRRGKAKIANDHPDRRLLVKLPTADVARRAIHKASALKRRQTNNGTPSVISNVLEPHKDAAFGIRLDGENMLLTDSLASIECPKFSHDPSWALLKSFSLSKPDQVHADDDEVLSAIFKKRAELETLESSQELKVRSLMSKVTEERLRFEKETRSRSKEKDALRGYSSVLERRKELDEAFQKQRDLDMDAVCDICNDGEVTPGNQILFCEACNVAVHQKCYGVAFVPEGDYYCVACRHFGREKMSYIASTQSQSGPVTLDLATTKLPVLCELCPGKQGAFIKTHMKSLLLEPGQKEVSKWVHVVCAKWQGLQFVDPTKKDVIEDVLPTKKAFRNLKTECFLCKSNRGSFNQCKHGGCERWLHVTCARSHGRCKVIHGENCEGELEPTNMPWSLYCPEHSKIADEDVPAGSVSAEKLQEMAKALPPDVWREPPKARPAKAFVKLDSKERKEFLAERESEKNLYIEIMQNKLHGVRCEVCHTCEEDGKHLTKCAQCGVVYCESCQLDPDVPPEGKPYICKSCNFMSEMRNKGEEYDPPQCVLCFQKGGWLRTAWGKPMKKWASSRQREFTRTLFSKSIWAHALCSMWQFPLITTNELDLSVDLSNVIMTHGLGFVQEKVRCGLCGKRHGLKMKCIGEGCRARGEKSRPYLFHLTCARQAGLEVDNRNTERGELQFYLHCQNHKGCEFAFRARIEDLIECEKTRAGDHLENESKPMSLNHASRLFNHAILVMHILGWAWRWAEWWVADGSKWEPLIEEGQDEKTMTKEQLKIVDSTPESRCEDARKCRLAALGAALRNRDFDAEEKGDTIIVDRALRAMLHTKSLVGPLNELEIDLLAQWLGMAYRSKSRLLGYGDDKIIVDEKFLVHADDKSPKFCLGTRRLPGKHTKEGEIFETDVKEPDDFLKPEVLDDGTLYSDFLESRKRHKGESKKATPKKGVSGDAKKGASKTGASGDTKKAASKSGVSGDVKKTASKTSVHGDVKKSVVKTGAQEDAKKAAPKTGAPGDAAAQPKPKKRRGRPPKSQTLAAKFAAENASSPSTTFGSPIAGASVIMPGKSEETPSTAPKTSKRTGKRKRSAPQKYTDSEFVGMDEFDSASDGLSSIAPSVRARNTSSGPKRAKRKSAPTSFLPESFQSEDSADDFVEFTSSTKRTRKCHSLGGVNGTIEPRAPIVPNEVNLEQANVAAIKGGGEEEEDSQFDDATEGPGSFTIPRKSPNSAQEEPQPDAPVSNRVAEPDRVTSRAVSRRARKLQLWQRRTR